MLAFVRISSICVCVFVQMRTYEYFCMCVCVCVVMCLLIGECVQCLHMCMYLYECASIRARLLPDDTVLRTTYVLPL